MSYNRRGTEYGAAVGRVRVKERMLFNKDYLLSLAETKSAAEAMEMLAKTNYAKYFTSATDKMDYENVIAAKWFSVRRLYRKVINDAVLMDVLWSRHDLSNTKILLKSKLSGSPVKGFSDIGMVDPEKLKKYIGGDEKASIPKWIYDGVPAAEKKFHASKDPKMIDIVLDKAHIGFIKERAKTKAGAFLKDLLRAEIDLHNIKTLMRIRSGADGSGMIDDILISGGSKAKSLYVQLAGASAEEVRSAFKDTAYGRVVKEGMDEHAKSSSFWKLEKLSDDHILGLARKIKHAVFGYEPLIGYVIARRSEERALRTIMEGKLAEMPPEFIKERMPEVYV
jgi:V/A-type H+-transporting ATPase subunit C